jgi:hypothetical protein
MGISVYVETADDEEAKRKENNEKGTKIPRR